MSDIPQSYTTQGTSKSPRRAGCAGVNRKEEQRPEGAAPEQKWRSVGAWRRAPGRVRRNIADFPARTPVNGWAGGSAR